MSEILKSARSAVLESGDAVNSSEIQDSNLGANPGPHNSLGVTVDLPAKVCFFAAFLALTSAGAGWAVNNFLTGWMEVAGMAAVGLFYLSLGLLELGRRPLS